MSQITRALISVSDKTGIVDLATFLTQQGVHILSTGGTAKKLKENNIPVQDVSEYTEFPEILDGRVKTLHPKVHGGLLFKREDKEHIQTVQEMNIEPIDLVIVNLYPFEETLSKENITKEELIEQIDIGGPSMLRSAAKNFSHVTVITDPTDYKIVQEEIQKTGNTTLETRKYLMGKAFARTAEYDACIAQHFSSTFFACTGHQSIALRYGENPHQKAGFYKNTLQTSGASLPNAEQLQGKELSYNNILDADAALKSIFTFPETPACVIVKHLSPCGIAIAQTLKEAYTNALAGDPISAFGGIVALNREVDEATATKCVEHFLEVILAPSFSEGAKKILAIQKQLRLLEIQDFFPSNNEIIIRSVCGGFVVQESDTHILDAKDITVVTKRAPTSQELANLLFAWKACKGVKSNAIVLAKNNATVGIGGGVTSRVDASELAVKKAGKNIHGAVAASDAFFPFDDGPAALGNAGITAIIQPGGSKRDSEVIRKCDELGIAMVFTGVRAFRH